MTDLTTAQIVEKLRDVAPEAMRPKSLVALLSAWEWHAQRDGDYNDNSRAKALADVTALLEGE